MEFDLDLDYKAPEQDEASPKNPRGAGRKRLPIDWKLVAYLFSIQCSVVEVAAALLMTKWGLDGRCISEHGIPIARFRDIYKEAGKASLRRKQWLLADTNATVAIFLGKQYLEQTDGYDLKHMGDMKVDVVNFGDGPLKKWADEGKDNPEQSDTDSDS